MAVPTRPVQDAIIDPVWGQWVHDTIAPLNSLSLGVADGMKTADNASHMQYVASDFGLSTIVGGIVTCDRQSPGERLGSFVLIAESWVWDPTHIAGRLAIVNLANGQNRFCQAANDRCRHRLGHLVNLKEAHRWSPTINTCANDDEFLGRVTACAAAEGYTDPPSVTWASLRWPVSAASDIEAAPTSALAGDNPSPGGDESVITDAMILSAVQAAPVAKR